MTTRPRGAVHDNPDIIFLLDVAAFLDQQPLHFLAFRAGLMRDEHFAEQLFGILANFIRALRDFHAARLAAAARMNLGFDDRTALPSSSAAATASSTVNATLPPGR